MGTSFVGAKPATSQECNTQSCIECRYDSSNYVSTQRANSGSCHRNTTRKVWDGKVVTGSNYTMGTLQSSDSHTGTGNCAGHYIRTARYEICKNGG